VAGPGAAEEDRELVADQLAAATGEDGRAVGETCPLLLAPVCRKTSDAARVRYRFCGGSGRCFYRRGKRRRLAGAKRTKRYQDLDAVNELL